MLSSFGRYLPGLSKTIKTDIYHCNVEAMRRPVDCFSADVVETYKILSSHWPSFSRDELEVLFKGSHQPLFLVPKKVKAGDDVWFLKKPVGKNSLGGTMKMLVESAGIDPRGRVITNKMMRRIGISRMEEAGVPVEKGMRITGHRDAKSYAKYRANDTEVDDRVCQDVISGTIAMVTGKCMHFVDILQLEMEKEKVQKVEDVGKAIAVASGVVPNSVCRSGVAVPEFTSGNSSGNPENSAGKFVFGSMSGNFQVFCNFSGQSDPSSVASTVASIVNNLKDGDRELTPDSKSPKADL